MEKVIDFYRRYEHFASPTFFVLGFLLDIFTLGRVDEATNIFLFLIYSLTATFIFLWELEIFELSHDKTPLKEIYKYRDEIFHFSQGALLSAFTLFYFKSASLATSLIFLLFMFSLLLLNELPAFQKRGPLFKGTLLQVTLFSFFLVYIPLIAGQVGTLIFIVVCLSYGALLAGGTWVLNKLKVDGVVLKNCWLYPGLIILGSMAFLRTFSLMPPVPLSLETAGIYHKVEKRYPFYNLYHEKEWWRFWNSSDEYFRAAPGDKIYFFTRVFAPGGFKDQVFLNWQRKVDGDWRTSDKIPFSISGGRTQGFRGYAYKSNYVPGDWRVLVETKGGLEVGRLNFEVEALPLNNKEERTFKSITDGKKED